MKDHDASGGRRIHVSEVPGEDKPIIQEMGGAARYVRVTGFIIGDDVYERRDRLMKALQESGPGLLVHPWLGQITAHVKTFSFQGRISEGGIVRFAIELVRVGAKPRRAGGQSARAERVAKTLEVADAVEKQLQEEFQSTFKLEGAASFVREAATEDVKAIADALEAQAPRVGEGITAFLLKVRDLGDTALAKAASPLELTASVQDQVKALSAGIGRRGEAIRTLLRLVDALPKLKSGESAQARTVETNREGMSALLAGAAFAEVVRRAVNGTWPSWESAKAAKEQIVTAIERHSSGVSLDAWTELHTLQAQVSQALPGPRGELSELRTLRLGASTPALVLAYRLHGSPTNSGDLVKRNGVAHPMFVPAEKDLEVLSVA